MKRCNKNTKQIACAYLLAAVLFVALGCVGLARGAYYSANGLRPNAQQLRFDELEKSSIVLQPNFGANAYVSTDGDPHFYWQQAAYLDTVVLKATYNSSPLGIVLYWKTDPAADYAEQNSVYATKTADGEYTFDLGGRLVQEIRIDPDSAGGVITWFDGVVLNPQTPWYKAFVPTPSQGLALIVLPLLAVAGWHEIAAVWAGLRNKAQPKGGGKSTL